MKKNIALFFCLVAMASLEVFAQTTPTITSRSGSSNQQSDDYLIGLKRLGIPTSATDNLDADFAAENTRKLLFNTTLNRLRIYNPATGAWMDAGATDIDSVAGLQAALNLKANTDGSNASGTWGINISGNAHTWGGYAADFTTAPTGSFVGLVGWSTIHSKFKEFDIPTIKNTLGLPASGMFDLQGVTDRGATTTRSLEITNNSSSIRHNLADGTHVLYTGLERGGFGGTSNDGLAYVYGNNAYHIATDGTKRFSVLGNGTVGINTTVPNTFYKLDVNGAAKASFARIENSSGGELFSIGQPYNYGSSKRLVFSSFPTDQNIEISGITDGIHYDQNIILQRYGGKVGIGTAAPESKLHVNGDIQSNGIIGGNGMYLNVLKVPSLTSSPAYFYIDTNIPANDLPAPQLDVTGYIYTGSNKAMKITLGWYYYSGNFYWSQFHSDFGYHKPRRVRLGKYMKNSREYIRVELSNDIYFANYSVSASDRGIGEMAYYKDWTYHEGEMPTGTTMQITEVAQPEVVSIDANVGIGVKNPEEKLAVKGKIKAQEIKVQPTGWADYVFEEGYQPLSLAELSAFVKQHKHLPEVPSAKEVAQNGLELGEMNKVLLKKIEELSLHLIEKDKELKTTNSRIDELAKALITLEKKLNDK